MKKTTLRKQAIAAEQIKKALEDRGLSNKQFAELMGRNPSEVSKWLSGKHNFTIALLQEISEVLKSDITGVDNLQSLVNGYENNSYANMLTESGISYRASNELYFKIRKRSEELGISGQKYIEQLVNEDILAAGTLPKVKLPLQESEIVKKYAGIIKVTPSAEELESDERLARIWMR